MDNLKKTAALVKSELKSNTGGEIVIVLMLTVMMICANIMTGAIGDYIGTLVYLIDSKAGNAVKIYDESALGDFSSIKDDPRVEYGIKVTDYNERLCALYGVSEKLFDENLPFLSKSNIDAVKNKIGSDSVPMLVSEATGFEVGQTGTLSDGSKYEIVGIIDNDDVQYFLFFTSRYEKFAIALDNGQFTALTPVTGPIMFTKLSDGTDKEKFRTETNSDKFAVMDFDPLKSLAADFSNSITLSVIGIITFVISLFGVIINCYLVFGSKRKYYRALMTVGGKKKTFLKCGAVIKLFQLVISLAVSIVGLLLFDLLSGGGSFSALSIIVSCLLAVLLIGLTYLLLSRWLNKLSCLEN